MKVFIFSALFACCSVGCFCSEIITVGTESRPLPRRIIKFHSDTSGAKFKASYYTYNKDTQENDLVDGKLIEISGEYALLGGDQVKTLVDIKQIVACRQHNYVYQTYYKPIEGVELDKVAEYLQIENLSDGALFYEVYEYGEHLDEKYLVTRARLGPHVTKKETGMYPF